MQANRALLFLLMLLVLAAVGFLVFRSPDQVGPAPAATPPVASGTADSASGDLAAAHDVAAPTATAEASLERSTVPVVVPDAGVPAIVGQLVDANDNPVAGAEVLVGPGMAMAAMSGSFDFGNFDPADLADEAPGFGPEQMAKLTAKQAAESARATSGPDGRFRVVPIGSSRGLGLRAIARGFALFDRTVTRPAGADVDLGALRLDRGAIVAGRVVDPAGNGIEGAVVSRLLDIEKGPMGQFEIDTPETQAAEQMRFGDTCTTDTAGHFELAHVPPGEFTLRARHPDHPTTKQGGQAAAGAAVGDLTITMPIGLEIRGVVVGVPDAKTRLQINASKKPGASAVPNPLMGMLGDDPSELLGDMGMSFGERSAEVDASGNFVLRGLRQDTYRIWLSQVGVGFAGSTICSDKQEVAAGSHGVQLRYEPGVRVTFVAVDAETNKPVERLWVNDRLRGGGGFADMMVMNMPSNARQQDYPGGVVTLANLRPKPKQKLTIGINAVGYGDWQRADIDLPQVGSLDLGTIRLEPKPVVQVTVIAADTGGPVVGAAVNVVDGPANEKDVWRNFAGMGRSSGPQAGKTGADGVCVLNARIDTQGFIKVDSKQYAPFLSDPIRFPAKGRTEVVARLLAGGKVEVAVVDLKGQAVVDASVDHRDVSGATSHGKTDAQGVARFEHLAPGKHQFQLGENLGAMANLMAAARPDTQKAAEDSAWEPVEVVDHGEAKLQLVKNPTAKLRGVVRENGVPLAGARVSFVEGRGSDTEGDAAEQMMGGMMEQFGGKNGRSAKTDDAGAFALAELPAGEHRLRVTHKERALPATIEIVLQNGDNVQDIELDMTAARGVVLDPEGNAVSGARVSVRVVRENASEADDLQDSIGSIMPFATPGGIKTELDGTFTLRGVPPDVKIKIVASAKDFAPAQLLTTVPRGTTSTSLQMRLGAAGRIKVTTTTDAAMAMVNARFVGDGDGQAPVMQVLRKGKGTLTGLRPGKWEVEIHAMQDNANGEKKRTVDVVAGETVEVEF